jgi:hypothetical protein
LAQPVSKKDKAKKRVIATLDSLTLKE